MKCSYLTCEDPATCLASLYVPVGDIPPDQVNPINSIEVVSGIFICQRHLDCIDPVRTFHKMEGGVKVITEEFDKRYPYCNTSLLRFDSIVAKGLPMDDPKARTYFALRQAAGYRDVSQN